MIILYLEILICFLFTIFFYLRYAKSNINPIITTVVLIVWFTTFFNSVLIPFDIYLAVSHTPDETIPKLKSLIYWLYALMQFMSIIVVPMLMEYEMAGEFTVKEKLITALKKNLLIYLIGLLLGIVFLGYLILKKELTG